MPRLASSERQRPALCELVHLVARRLSERAGAVGVAGQKRPAADRPGEVARRAGELPGAAGYLQGELRRAGEQTAVRVDMKRQALPERADHVQGAAGEDQIVLANGIAGHDLDEPADALEYPPGAHHAAYDRPGVRTRHGCEHDGAAEPLT